MDKQLAHLHLRVTPSTKRRIEKAARAAGLPVTVFGEAVFATRSAELGRDPDVIAHGNKVAETRRNRKR